MKEFRARESRSAGRTAAGSTSSLRWWDTGQRQEGAAQDSHRASCRVGVHLQQPRGTVPDIRATDAACSIRRMKWTTSARNGRRLAAAYKAGFASYGFAGGGFAYLLRTSRRGGSRTCAARRLVPEATRRASCHAVTGPLPRGVADTDVLTGLERSMKIVASPGRLGDPAVVHEDELPHQHSTELHAGCHGRSTRGGPKGVSDADQTSCAKS